MRSWATAIAIGTLAVTAAGCVSAENAETPAQKLATEAAVPVASGPNSAALQGELLTIDDFPSGWRTTAVDTSGSDGGTRFACTLAAPPPQHSAEAEADFASGSVETVYAVLDAYTSPDRASAVFAQSVAYIRSCSGATVDGNHFTIGQLSFAPAGEQHVGVSFDGAIDGVDVEVQYVYALQGSVIAQIQHADISPVDSDLTSSLLGKAVQRVGSGTS